MSLSTTVSTRRPPSTPPRPNEPCWCGSGDKYKKCHKEDDVVFFKGEKKWLEENRVRPGTLSPAPHRAAAHSAA